MYLVNLLLYFKKYSNYKQNFIFLNKKQNLLSKMVFENNLRTYSFNKNFNKNNKNFNKNNKNFNKNNKNFNKNNKNFNKNFNKILFNDNEKNFELPQKKKNIEILKSRKDLFNNLYSDNILKIKKRNLKFLKKSFKKSFSSFIKRFYFYNSLAVNNKWKGVWFDFLLIKNRELIQYHEYINPFIIGRNFFSSPVIIYNNLTIYNSKFFLPPLTNKFFRKTFKHLKVLKKNNKLFKFIIKNKSFYFWLEKKLFKKNYLKFLKKFCTKFFEKTNKLHRYFFLSKYNTYWKILNGKPLVFHNYLSPTKKSDKFLSWYPHMGGLLFFWSFLKGIKRKNKFITSNIFLLNKIFLKSFLLSYNNNIVNKLPSNIFTKKTDIYFNIIGEYLSVILNNLFSKSKSGYSELLKYMIKILNKENFLEFYKKKKIWKNVIGKLFRILYSLNWTTAKWFFRYNIKSLNYTTLDHLQGKIAYRIDLILNKNFSYNWTNFWKYQKKLLFDPWNFHYRRIIWEVLPEKKFMEFKLRHVGQLGSWVQVFNFNYLNSFLRNFILKKTINKNLKSTINSFFFKFIYKDIKNLELNILVNDLKYERFFFSKPFSSLINFFNKSFLLKSKSIKINREFFIPTSLILASNIYFEPFSILNSSNYTKFFIRKLNITTKNINVNEILDNNFFLKKKNWRISGLYLLSNIINIIVVKNYFLTNVLKIISKYNFLFSYYFYSKIIFKNNFFNFFLFLLKALFYIKLDNKIKYQSSKDIFFFEKNISFEEEKTSWLIFTNYSKNVLNSWFFFYTNFKLKKKKTISIFRYVGNNIQKKTGSLISSNFHFNVFIAPVFKQFSLDLRNISFFSYNLKKKYLIDKLVTKKINFILGKTIDYFYLEIFFKKSYSYYPGNLKNHIFLNYLGNKNMIFKIKNQLLKINSINYSLKQYQFFYYWFWYFSNFNKYNLFILTSLMRWKIKKINLYILPITIILKNLNFQLLKQNSKNVYKYSLYLESLSASEIDLLWFSDFIFSYKLNPSKFFLGKIFNSSELNLTNNFFFFLKKKLLQYNTINRNFSNLFLLNNTIFFTIISNSRYNFKNIYFDKTFLSTSLYVNFVLKKKLFYKYLGFSELNIKGSYFSSFNNLLLYYYNFSRIIKLNSFYYSIGNFFKLKDFNFNKTLTLNFLSNKYTNFNLYFKFNNTNLLKFVYLKFFFNNTNLSLPFDSKNWFSKSNHFPLLKNNFFNKGNLNINDKKNIIKKKEIYNLTARKIKINLIRLNIKNLKAFNQKTDLCKINVFNDIFFFKKKNIIKNINFNTLKIKINVFFKEYRKLYFYKNMNIIKYLYLNYSYFIFFFWLLILKPSILNRKIIIFFKNFIYIYFKIRIFIIKLSKLFNNKNSNFKILTLLKLKKLNNLNYKTIIKYNYLLFNFKDYLIVLLKNFSILKKKLNFVNNLHYNTIKINFYSIVMYKLFFNNFFLKIIKFSNSYLFYYINISFLNFFFKFIKKSDYLFVKVALPYSSFNFSLKKNYSFFFSSLIFYNELTNWMFCLLKNSIFFQNFYFWVPLKELKNKSFEKKNVVKYNLVNTINIMSKKNFKNLNWKIFYLNKIFKYFNIKFNIKIFKKKELNKLNNFNLFNSFFLKNLYLFFIINRKQIINFFSLYSLININFFLFKCNYFKTNNLRLPLGFLKNPMATINYESLLMELIGLINILILFLNKKFKIENFFFYSYVFFIHMFFYKKFLYFIKFLKYKNFIKYKNFFSISLFLLNYLNKKFKIKNFSLSFCNSKFKVTPLFLNFISNSPFILKNNFLTINKKPLKNNFLTINKNNFLYDYITLKKLNSFNFNKNFKFLFFWINDIFLNLCFLKFTNFFKLINLKKNIVIILYYYYLFKYVY